MSSRRVNFSGRRVLLRKELGNAVLVVQASWRFLWGGRQAPGGPWQKSDRPNPSVLGSKSSSTVDP